MSSFVGTGDGKESLADFLANVEMAARSWNAVYGQCCRATWRVCGGVWAVAMEWGVRGGDPQVFRFLCFYSLLYSRMFPRS